MQPLKDPGKGRYKLGNIIYHNRFSKRKGTESIEQSKFVNGQMKIRQMKISVADHKTTAPRNGKEVTHSIHG